MNLYINLLTKEYPVKPESIESVYPKLIVEGETIDAIYKYALVIPIPKPSVGKYHTVKEIEPRLNPSGLYEQQYVVKCIFKDIERPDGSISTAEDQLSAILIEDDNRKCNVIRNNIHHEIRRRLDAFARLKEFDDIKSLAIRAGYDGPYRKMGLFGAKLMDDTHFTLETIFKDVKNGKRLHPNSLKEIEKELPILDWARLE